jgi:hypothetical protein
MHSLNRTGRFEWPRSDKSFVAIDYGAFLTSQLGSGNESARYEPS